MQPHLPDGACSRNHASQSLGAKELKSTGVELIVALHAQKQLKVLESNYFCPVFQSGRCAGQFVWQVAVKGGRLIMKCLVNLHYGENKVFLLGCGLMYL